MISDMISGAKQPSSKTIVTAAASAIASAMVIRSIARDFIPSEIRNYYFSRISRLFMSFSNEIVLVIKEYCGLESNQIYKAADIYIGAKISPSITQFNVTMPEKESKISISMAKNQEVVDKFNGVQFKWTQITRNKGRVTRHSAQSTTSQPSEMRYFTLSFHKKHKEMVLETYFPFILEESKKVKEEKKTLKIHTLSSENARRYNGDYSWSSVKLDHPATFETLAMDTEQKKMIIDDLDRFLRRKQFYKKVGKAWKRGYLLYGPPGTGKSSLIAAMANHLNFDIYDLELTDIRTNSDLRRLLINTANQSILVVEDIDRTLELEGRKAEDKTLKILQSNQVKQAQTINIHRNNQPEQITLSGLLNFIDGLWSSCGDERIIVVTTNHKECLDPALLRPGRMDMHIHMSYCNSCAFKTLASNYLGITNHGRFPEINSLLEEGKVSPAEVAEQLMRNEDPELAIEGLIEFLHEKKRENEETEAKKLKQGAEEEEEEKNTENIDE